MQSGTSWRVVASKPNRPRAVVCLQPRCCRVATYSSTPDAKKARPKQRTVASSPNSQQQWKKFNQTNKAQKSGFLELNDREVIKPHSLAETLQAHRAANANRVPIQRTKSTGPGPLPADPPSYSAQHVELDRNIRKTWQAPKQEYKGLPRTLAFDWVLVGSVDRYLSMPWMQEMDAMNHIKQRATERLTAEIRAADTFLTPSASELTAAREVQGELAKWTKETFKPFVKYELMGSRVTGMASSISDIDVKVHFTSSYEEKKDKVEILGALYRQMKQSAREDVPFITNCYLSQTRVPIIELTHGPTGLTIQIQSASNEPGNEDVIRGLAADHLSLRPLFRILKQTLKMRGCASGQHGGLTSYPLLIMIAVSLKLHVLEVNQTDLGQSLLDFLKFWAQIDFYKTAIVHVPCDPLGYLAPPVDLKEEFGSAEATERMVAAIVDDPVGARPVLFEKNKSLGKYHESSNDFMMVLYDPADPYNDLGRSAHLIKHIQATLMKIRQDVEKDMEKYDANSSTASRVSFLRHLIEGDYSLYNIERKRVRPSNNFIPQSNLENV